MLTYKRLLAASSAIVLGAGSGFATSVLAQVPNSSGTTQSTTPSGAARAGDTTGGMNITSRAESNFARDRNITVMQRPREGYEARGVRAGTFLVFPKIALTAEHNDNIYARDDNEIDDNIIRIAPEVTFNSDWNRHQVFGYARAIVNQFQDNEDENTTDWLVGVAGRLDVSRDTRVNGRFDWSHLTEPRTAPGAPQSALEPVQYDLRAVALGFQHEFNRLMVAGRFDARTFEYDNPPRQGGGTVDQSFRDRTVTTLGGRADYAVSPATAFFVDLSTNKHEYDRGASATNINRDSDGYQALVGVNFELGAVTRGEIGVGYLSQSFDDPSHGDIDGFGARAQLEWFPTQLTTVTLTGTRTIEDSPVPGAAGYLSTNLGARVDHELLRNVILSGYAGWGNDDYENIGREDRRNTLGVSATYLLNRNVGLTVSFDRSKQDTRRGAGNDFEQNRVGATLTAQF
ncbi:outer membrane beta-barrel protein [Phenylobacterium sp.]|uniref:outer membrane beta-barrel protein n=1 Tax=Phenylobacterium sp. TaxID=1871053 RepID=UPI002F93D8EC